MCVFHSMFFSSFNIKTTSNLPYIIMHKSSYCYLYILKNVSFYYTVYIQCTHLSLLKSHYTVLYGDLEKSQLIILCIFNIEPNDDFFNNISFTADIVIEDYVVTKKDI